MTVERVASCDHCGKEEREPHEADPRDRPTAVGTIRRFSFSLCASELPRAIAAEQSALVDIAGATVDLCGTCAGRAEKEVMSWREPAAKETGRRPAALAEG